MTGALRKWHARIGLVGAGFLAISAATGLLWAYAPYLYWADGYMERKHPNRDIPLAKAAVSLPEALDKARQRFGRDWEPRKIILMADAGRLVFRMDLEDAKGKNKDKRSALLDASTGEWLSPLRRDQACVLARQYVAGNPPIMRADSLASWLPRKGKPPRPAWRVAFADARHTRIVLDPFTGEILEDEDDIRRFHFWIMRLHQLNFFGTRKILTVFNGLPLLALVFTGIWLGTRRRQRRKGALRRRSPVDGRPEMSEA